MRDSGIQRDTEICRDIQRGTLRQTANQPIIQTERYSKRDKIERERLAERERETDRGT